jgi:hypothetical protein
MYDKQWTLEQHFEDLEKKKLALRRMTEHHEEEAAKCRLRERRLVLTHLSMVNDVINDLWWEIGELQDSLENRDSILYIKEQSERNKAWSKWVELKQKRISLFKIHRELMECL